MLKWSVLLVRVVPRYPYFAVCLAQGFWCLGGGMGVLLQSNVPLSWAYTESLVLSIEGRRKLSVISACSNRQCQLYMGKSGSLEQIPEMNWSLKVLIARSAALCKWIYWGYNWKSMLLDLSSLWKSGEVSFSSLIYADLSPLISRCSWRSVKTQTNLLSALDFM